MKKLVKYSLIIVGIGLCHAGYVKLSAKMLSEQQVNCATCTPPNTVNQTPQ